MAYIVGGSFFMGSDEGTPAEKPSHKVMVPPYCMDIHEVTTAKYLACSNGGWCKRAATTSVDEGVKSTEQDAYDGLCNQRDPVGHAEHPINCVTWAQAYAFCIWDGGFLPSEAEWNYVAAGGGAELEYPWSGTTDAGPLGIGCDEAVYVSATAQCSPYVMPVGSTSPQGDGLWGQADLAGNVLEWALDLYTSPYPGDCHDCASLPLPGSDAGVALRVQRGGSFVSSAAEVTASARGFSPEALASYAGGFRCARPP